MNKLVCSFAVLCALVLAFSACSKEAITPAEQAVTTEANDAEQRYLGTEVPLDLDFEMSLSEDEARAFNLSYDANNKQFPTIQLAVGNSVRGRIYIAGRPKGSTANAPESMFSKSEASFTVKSISADGRRIRFTVGGKAWINGYSEATKNNFDWYISVVLGESRARFDGAKRYVEYAPFPRTQQVSLPNSPTETQTIQSLRVSNGMLPVPYGFGWTKFTWDNLKGLYRNAQIKPLGILLRFNIKNENHSSIDLPQLRNYSLYKIDFESESLFPNARFNPQLTNAALTSQGINWENNHTSNVWTYQPTIVSGTGYVAGEARRATLLIPNTQSRPNGTDYFFVWFANTKASGNRLKITLHGEGSGNARPTYVFNTTLSLANNTGTSPTRTLRLVPRTTTSSSVTPDDWVDLNERLVHPMYWMTADLGKVGKPETFEGLEMINQRTSGYDSYGFDGFNMLYNEENRGVHYNGARNDKRNGEINRYLPTAQDWMTILPVQHYFRQNIWAYNDSNDSRQFSRSTARYVYKNGTNDNRDFAMARTTVGRHRPYYIDADYYYTASNKFYGLRFKGEAYLDPNFARGVLYPKPNEFRSAWRYTLEPNRGLKVDIVHIGSEDPYLNKTDVTINDINNDAYFEQAARMGRMITMYFPVGGNSWRPNSHARYLTSTLHDQGRSISFMNIAPEGIHLSTQNKVTVYPSDKQSKVRFFVVNPFDGVEDTRPGLQRSDLDGYTPNP